MSLSREIIAVFFFALGIIFGTGGVIGIHRFPDPYSRLQAGSLAGTTAVISFFLGALVLAPTIAIALRIILIIFFFLLSSPTGGHIVARFTWNAGVQAWRPRGMLKSGIHRDELKKREET